MAEPLIEPRDEHNLRLIANVHPPDWVNPEPAERYHMVVIGAGTAGLVGFPRSHADPRVVDDSDPGRIHESGEHHDENHNAESPGEADSRGG